MQSKGTSDTELFSSRDSWRHRVEQQVPPLRYARSEAVYFIEFSREVPESNEFVLLCLSVHPI
jgi:hypothetical protein